MKRRKINPFTGINSHEMELSRKIEAELKSKLSATNVSVLVSLKEM